MSDIDFKFESFEEYFGGAEQVKKTMDECKVCGSKLLLSPICRITKIFWYRKLHVAWIVVAETVE
jgi:ssDNA-binding Zn-finger/Zn-ribbon topoisomerase 1